MANRKRGFIYHLHPEEVPWPVLRFTHTFGLGGMAFVLFLLLVITGVLLRFVYEPSPAEAYDSILFLRDQVRFGGFIRNIHHLSGTLLIFVSLLHLLRVLFTGAISGARAVNWILGVVLFFGILFSNFTGYLLPWDQLSYWAVTVVTRMLEYIPLIGEQVASGIRGGDEVAGPTLNIFFNFHTAILPFTLFVVMLFHFWKVRTAGGVVIPRNGKTRNRGMAPVVPELVVREGVVALILLAIIFFLAVFLDAPLRAPANPALSPDPAKAPWYFMGIQELIMHFHPFFAVFIIPVSIMILMFYLPYIHHNGKNPGVWFSSEQGKRIVLFSFIIALILHPLLIAGDEYLFHFNSWFPNLPQVVREGFLPFLLYTLFFTVYYFLMQKIFKPTGFENILGIVSYMLTAYTILSLTGIFFRGPGMQLMWPWKI